jgi:RNA polymerase sigma-32 factor
MAQKKTASKTSTTKAVAKKKSLSSEKVTTKAPARAGKSIARAQRASDKIEEKNKALGKTVVAEIVDRDGDTEARLNSAEADKAYTLPSEPAETMEPIEPIETSHAPAIAVTDKAITSTDPLAMYLNEIRHYRVLSKEEEQQLAKRYYEHKDPTAAEALVKANLRFVVKVAAEYSKFGAKMIDLIQEGNVGLMHAVREFNPYKGARLITYAVWWIRGYIQEYLMRQYSMVRIGTTQNQRKLFYQLQREKEALDAMGIEPNAALISSRLGIPEDEVRDMTQRMSGRDLSLDKPIDEDSGVSLGDLQKDQQDMSLDERLARQEQLEILKQKIEEIRPELSEREKIILDERILNDEPLTLQEIGEKYGITREAVRQMESRLMKKIKTKMEETAE